MSLVSWEPETQVMPLLLECPHYPSFRSENPSRTFSEDMALGPLRRMPDGESLRGDTGRCAESRLYHRKCGQMRGQSQLIRSVPTDKGGTAIAVCPTPRYPIHQEMLLSAPGDGMEPAEGKR